MSSRTVAYALAGTATGALLLLGLKGTEASGVVDQATHARRADVSDLPKPPGPPRAGDYALHGTLVTTPFGPVRVRVTFHDGKIKAIDAVLTPTDHGFSLELNRYAVPILDREVLKADSAVIDVVSGATYTSDAYAQSLQAALYTAATR